MGSLYGWRELMNTDGNRRKREIREVLEGTGSNERQQKYSKAGSFPPKHPRSIKKTAG